MLTGATRRRGRRRAALAVLLYLLPAAWLLPGGLDLLFPRTKTVVAGAEFGCAPHGCGCASEARMRKACCCTAGAPEAPSAEKRTVPVSAIEEARCAGREDALAQLLSQPALPSLAGELFIHEAGGRLEPPERRPAPSVRSAPSDKVPLA